MLVVLENMLVFEVICVCECVFFVVVGEVIVE